MRRRSHLRGRVSTGTSACRPMRQSVLGATALAETVTVTPFAEFMDNVAPFSCVRHVVFRPSPISTRSCAAGLGGRTASNRLNSIQGCPTSVDWPIAMRYLVHTRNRRGERQGGGKADCSQWQAPVTPESGQIGDDVLDTGFCFLEGWAHEQLQLGGLFRNQRVRCRQVPAGGQCREVGIDRATFVHVDCLVQLRAPYGVHLR